MAENQTREQRAKAAEESSAEDVPGEDVQVVEHTAEERRAAMMPLVRLQAGQMLGVLAKMTSKASKVMETWEDGQGRKKPDWRLSLAQWCKHRPSSITVQTNNGPISIGQRLVAETAAACLIRAGKCAGKARLDSVSDGSEVSDGYSYKHVGPTLYCTTTRLQSGWLADREYAAGYRRQSSAGLYSADNLLSDEEQLAVDEALAEVDFTV